jgi:hypothetical protein
MPQRSRVHVEQRSWSSFLLVEWIDMKSNGGAV